MLVGLLSPSPQAQPGTDTVEQIITLGGRHAPIAAQGWRGFTDVAFLGTVVLDLVLAASLGALIAYHPRMRRTIDSLAEAEAQKVYVLYSVIGAITGIMVLKYGAAVGFVVFGIGGLIRFRTDLRSAPATGRLIFVTLIGLSCGLGLPHLAVLGTAFGWALLAVLDTRVTYQIVVKGLAPPVVAAAAAAYRQMLERHGCRVLGERKSFTKEQVALVFRAPGRLTREQIEERFGVEIPDQLRGAVDWAAD